MTRAHVLAAVAGLALAAAGCGSSGRSACPHGDTDPVQRGSAVGVRYLAGVTVSRTACADRVEFRFEHGVPGYRVEYLGARRAQTEDASGRHIPVSGRAYLVVRLAAAATARTQGDALTRTYTGSRRVPGAGATHVREVVKTGDFEAVVTWTIGVDDRQPFAVSRAPDSLAVDVG